MKWSVVSSQTGKSLECTLLMMPCSVKCVQQKRQNPGPAARRHDLFRKVGIFDKGAKSAMAQVFDFAQVLQHSSWRIQRFRQRPFPWIVPKIRGQTAKALLDYCRRAQDLLATTIVRTAHCPRVE